MAVDTTKYPAIQGKNLVLFARKLSEAKTKRGMPVPYQTSLDFEPQRDSKTDATKDGYVSKQSPLQTDLKFEFVNNWSEIADKLQLSLFNGDVMEFWIVNYQRRNSEGKCFAYYMRGTVSEDDVDGDPDDVSSRKTTITVEGTPVMGWTALTDEEEQMLAYVFRGVGAIGDSAKDDGTAGGGAAWVDSDAGTGVAYDTSKADAPASGEHTGSDPAGGDHTAHQ